MKIFQFKSETSINNFINETSINNFINEISSALDFIKEANRSHPEKRKRSECGEELDYNKIYKQDNSVSHCIPSGLPQSTLSQFNDNMKVNLDEGEMEDCKECGQQLKSQTM